MKRLRKLWKESPKARFYARTIVVAVAGYAVQTIRSGEPFTWAALATGGFTAAVTAIVGLTTPVEPFVGINKAKVDVPSPPAEPT